MTGVGRSSFDASSSPVSPRLAALRADPFAAPYDADSSLAAELVLALYHSHSSSDDALIMLSQLQVSLIQFPRFQFQCIHADRWLQGRAAQYEISQPNAAHWV